MVSIMFYNLYINDVDLPVKLINVSNDVKQGGYIFSSFSGLVIILKETNIVRVC